MGFELRQYQKDCIEAIHRSKNKFNLIMSSVGSGKTIVFSTIAAEAKGRVLIVVPSTELREQAEEKLREINPDISVGSVQADLDDVDAKIVVSSRQSLAHTKSTRLKRMLQHGDFEYLIFDECHIAPESLKKVINKVNNNIKILGFTATPYTKQCRDIFGEPIFQKTILDMIEMDFLVEPYAITVQSKTNISEVKTTKGDFVAGELESVVNNDERNALIIKAYKEYAKDRKLTLVFAAGCDHGKELLKEFEYAGITSAYIDGETPKDVRKDIIDKYKKFKIPVLINVLTLTTGFDVPATDCIMVCRPSKSRILFEQILGRGLRLFKGKSDCLLIDIQDISKSHDLMDVSAVFEMKIRSGETYKKAKKRVDEEKAVFEKIKAEEKVRRDIEIELIAQRVKLFNKDMKLAFKERRYDWWKCDNLTYALTYAMNEHYVIENYNEGFNILRINTDKENKSAEIIENKVNITDAIQYIEKIVRINGYSDPNTDWKKARPSEKQLKYCSWAQSSWDVTKHFTSGTITSLAKKANREQAI